MSDSTTSVNGHVPVTDAAVRLGISPDAVRKRLERGKLPGYKQAGRWLVDLTATGQSDRHRTAVSADTTRLTGPDRSPSDTTTPLTGQSDTRHPEMSPLTTLIVDLTRQNQELAVAAALWQERARSLETELLALRAGPIAGDSEPAVQDVNLPPSRDDTATDASETYAPVSDTLALGWRRWWQRITGVDRKR